MRAELKQLHSPDIYDLDSFQPKDPSNFGFLLQAMIGIEGEEGEESFDIMVFTPEWLKSNYAKGDIIWGRHSIIVFEYNIKLIRHHIEKYIEECVGENWQQIADRLARIGKWEFEDYKPYRPC